MDRFATMVNFFNIFVEIDPTPTPPARGGAFSISPSLAEGD
ncbi:hypothetical protein [Helicobacter sp. 23-1045]